MVGASLAGALESGFLERPQHAGIVGAGLAPSLCFLAGALGAGSLESPLRASWRRYWSAEPIQLQVRAAQQQDPYPRAPRDVIRE